jgi:hypothetical protein
LQIKKADLKQCHQVNKEEIEKRDELITRINELVEIQKNIEKNISEAKQRIEIYEIKAQTQLEKKIVKLTSLPRTNCDDMPISDDVIELWYQTDN